MIIFWSGVIMSAFLMLVFLFSPQKIEMMWVLFPLTISISLLILREISYAIIRIIFHFKTKRMLKIYDFKEEEK